MRIALGLREETWRKMWRCENVKPFGDQDVRGKSFAVWNSHCETLRTTFIPIPLLRKMPIAGRFEHAPPHHTDAKFFSSLRRPVKLPIIVGYRTKYIER